MGLFGLFKKKNKDQPQISGAPMPPTLPTPPSSPTAKREAMRLSPVPSPIPQFSSLSEKGRDMQIPEPAPPSKMAAAQIIPEPKHTIEMYDFDEDIKKPQAIDDFGIPSLGTELPDIDIPDLEFPEPQKREVVVAIKRAAAEERKIEKSVKKKISVKEIPPLDEAKEEKEKSMRIKAPELEPVSAVKGAIFLPANQFNSVKMALSSIKGNIKNSETALNKLNGVKNMQDSAFESWHAGIESVQRKLIMLDHMLFEKGE